MPPLTLQLAYGTLYSELRKGVQLTFWSFCGRQLSRRERESFLPPRGTCAPSGEDCWVRTSTRTGGILGRTASQEVLRQQGEKGPESARAVDECLEQLIGKTLF